LSVFPHATLWFSPLRQNAVLIGTQRELEIDYGRLVSAFEDEVISRELESVNVADPIGFLSGFLMGEEVLAEYVGNVPDNTDNNPVLEFTPAMAYFLAGMYRLRNVFDFRDARESVLPWVVNLGEAAAEVAVVTEAIERRYEAVGYSINGDIALVLGERERAIEEYNQALAVDPLERNWLTATSGLENPRR
jgi:tetratricopeptide (TPR) repeat protein